MSAPFAEPASTNLASARARAADRRVPPTSTSENARPGQGRAPFGHSSQQGLASSQHGLTSSQQGCAACAAVPKVNSRTRVERIVRNILISVDWKRLSRGESTGRWFGGSRLNAATGRGRADEPGGIREHLRRRAHAFCCDAGLAARAGENGTECGLAVTAGASFPRGLCCRRGGHDDGRERDPRHRRKQGQARQDTGEDLDHADRLGLFAAFVRIGRVTGQHDPVTATAADLAGPSLVLPPCVAEAKC